MFIYYIFKGYIDHLTCVLKEEYVSSISVYQTACKKQIPTLD